MVMLLLFSSRMETSLSLSLKMIVFCAGVAMVKTLFSSSNLILIFDLDTNALIAFFSSGPRPLPGACLELLYILPKITGLRGSSFKKPSTTSSPTSGIKNVPAPLVA
ncbi:hypothetical protein D3C85_958270 [compost metagenome]